MSNTPSTEVLFTDMHPDALELLLNMHTSGEDAMAVIEEIEDLTGMSFREVLLRLRNELRDASGVTSIDLHSH